MSDKYCYLFTYFTNDIIFFVIENIDIVCEISKEIAIFIGQDEEDNEILLRDFFSMFKTQLFNFVGEDLSREKILNHYKEVVMLIDEMVVGGIVLNIDEHSLYDRVKNSEKQKKEEKSQGGLMSGLFGYFTGKSSSQTPSEQKKEEKESNNIFGGLMASARGYLKKNIEY